MACMCLCKSMTANPQSTDQVFSASSQNIITLQLSEVSNGLLWESISKPDK